MTQVKKYLDLGKQYSFPKNLSVVRYNGRILVIAVDKANWLLLDNDQQLHFFNLLIGQSIKDAIDSFAGSEDDYKSVITQIEARNFEREDVHSVIVNKLQLFVTNACNLSCPHCYMFAGIKEQYELSTNEVFEILSSFSAHGGESVVLTGGEVRMRPDFFSIVKYANSLGLTIEVLTNGTLWSDSDIVDYSQYIESVQISVDGFDEASNSKVRGTGSFQKSLQCIDRFIQLGVHTEVAITPYLDDELESNINNYVRFGKRLLHKYEGKPFRLNFTSDIMPGREIAITDEIHDRYASIVSEIYNKCFGEMAHNPFISTIKNHEIFNNCAYGNLAINSTGDVFLCGKIANLFPYANIRECDIDTLFELSKKLKQLSDVNNLSPCKTCEVKYVCGGECRIKNFPAFTNNDALNESADFNRECDPKRKAFIYDLMIKTNSELYE